MDSNGLTDETSERRLYIGNLDQRITEPVLIKMFSPYGKIESEEFLWHTRGPKRGDPHGFAFIQFSTKEKMNGRLACGRPLVIRYASEKYYLEMSSTSQKPPMLVLSVKRRKQVKHVVVLIRFSHASRKTGDFS
ncbi:hypothetical protein MKW92_032885 [Papaver armeniacum]|nr:hypothetical protein MKW92_032885 [Papaver armeniacum]